MHYKTFDTHKYIKSLQETGFNEQQAEVLVKSLLESRDFDLSILATRQQVAAVKSDLQKDIAEVKVEISEVKSDLQKEISEVKIEIAQLDKKLSKEISAVQAGILKWVIPMFITMLIAIFLKS